MFRRLSITIFDRAQYQCTVDYYKKYGFLTPFSCVHVFKGKLHVPLEVVLHLLSPVRRLEDHWRYLKCLLPPPEHVSLLHVLQFNKEPIAVLRRPKQGLTLTVVGPPRTYKMLGQMGSVHISCIHTMK